MKIFAPRGIRQISLDGRDLRAEKHVMRHVMSRFFLAVAAFIFLANNSADAAPYYRFWQGWKSDVVRGEPQSYGDFALSLNRYFIPATVQYGAGKGLISYQPVLAMNPDALAHGRALGYDLPDEIALVGYESQDVYDQLRQTPEGQKYADLHSVFFNLNNRRSHSLVPQRFTGSVVAGTAYDVLQSGESWMNLLSRGHEARFAIYFRSDRADDETYYDTLNRYLQTVQQGGPADGLFSHLILIQDRYWIVYRLWRNHDDAVRFDRSNVAAALNFLALGKVELPVLEYVPGDPQHGVLTYGRAVSVKF
jgi:hypothetical protein